MLVRSKKLLYKVKKGVSKSHIPDPKGTQQYVPQDLTSPTTNHGTNLTLQRANFTHFVQPSSKRRNASVSFNRPDLNSDLNCVSNHQAKDKAVVHSINLVNTEGIANLLKHNSVTQTRKVDVGIHSEVAHISQAQITTHCDTIRVNQPNEDIAAIVQECTEDLSLELQNSFSSLDVVNLVDLGEALSEELENIDASSDMQKAVHDAPIVTPTEDVELAPVPMPQPVTTKFAGLTNDKLPSSQTLIPASKPLSTAALKSVQIISKFWGDEVEQGEVEEDIAEAIVSDFEQHYPSLFESTKAEKKKKKHVIKVKPGSFNSAGMRTRAQKGTFKIDLATTE